MDSSRALRITLVYGEKQHVLTVYPDEDEAGALLQHQIWSLEPELPPDVQSVSGLVPGVLCASSSLEGVQDGTFALLERKQPPQLPSPRRSR